MSRHKRDVVKAFREAGLDVEVETTKKHFRLRLDGEIVYTLSTGTKQTWRTDADVRRRIRRIKEGRSPHAPKFNQN